MKITIAGCGNAGSTVAADLALKGHDVTILKTSNKMHNEHFKTIKDSHKIVLLEDGLEKVASVKTSENIDDAVQGRELIIIFIQTSYHEDLIKKLAKSLEDGQMVMLQPGYLSTCYFLKYCHKKITIIEAESSPIDCRIVKPGVVKVLFRNVRNPLGVYPIADQEKAQEALSKLDLNFEANKTVVEAALHNPNLIVHTIGAVLSIPRIEYVNKVGGTYSMYKEVFTPSVWNTVIALDCEKMNVLEALGCSRLPYVEACKYRNSLDDDSDATEVFFDYANNSAPDGPHVPNSRYVTEDVSQGLVLLESLGKALGVETPVCTALIELASSSLGVGFRDMGRSLEKLGKEFVDRICYDISVQH